MTMRTNRKCNRQRRLHVAVLSIAVLFCLAGDVEALVIDAVADIWIRESDPTGGYSNDLISVWDGTTTDQRRHGVVMFDLSSTIGVTIDTAFLNLFDRDDARSAGASIVQQAFLLDATPPTFPASFESYSWEEYITFDEGQNESALSSLGAYDIAVGDTIDGYEASNFATGGDISLLQQTRDAQTGNQTNLVVFVLKATSGERDWGDIEVDSTPPQLVINEDFPDPGDFNNDGFVNTTDYQIIIDPNNWLQDVPNGTLGGRGDLTGNGFVDLDDFSGFKPLFEAANPGVPLAAPVPEPKTFVAALICGLCASMALRQRAQRRLFVPVPTAANCRVPPAASGVRWERCVLLGVLATFALSGAAQAIEIEASTDVWIRESDPDRGVFESDLMSVWNSFGNDGARRYGIVEFDVSSLNGVDIEDAGLQLWDATNGFSDDAKPIKQSAVVIDTTGGTQVAGFTWNIYQSEYAAGATPLDGLGLYDLPGQPSPDAYQNSVGSETDELLIESIANNVGGNQLLTIVLIANEADGIDYAHSWGDGPDGFGGENARLIINDPFPEDVELALQINAASGAMSIVNPGVDTREDTMFEIDGYLIRSPDDDGLDPLNPAGFTGLTGAGETGWDIVAPTANALTELSLTSSVTLSEGDSFSLGTGYVPGAAEDPGLTFQYNLAGGGTAFGDVIYVTGTDVDADGDGNIDGNDLVLLQRTNAALIGQWNAEFGMTAAQAAAGAVPEPGTCLLLCLGAAIWTGPRRRQ